MMSEMGQSQKDKNWMIPLTEGTWSSHIYRHKVPAKKWHRVCTIVGFYYLSVLLQKKK